MLYPAGMRAVAQHLHAHPDGVSPHMATRADGAVFASTNLDLGWFNRLGSQGADADYVEACGAVGDVFLLHPLMLHSPTHNSRRCVRIITNPPVSLRAPFRFDRAEDGSEGEYSLVERATLRMLGKEGEGLRGWKITRPREKVVPERLRIQEQMKREELERLEAEKRKVVAASAAVAG